MTRYVLGIDGGGTSCRAAVGDDRGRILGRGKSGAANILSDPDTALGNIVKAAEAAFVDAALDPALMAATPAVLGLAGNNVGTAIAYVHQRLPFAQSVIESDGLIALQGALGDADGAIAILGTGTIFITRHLGAVRYIGGWGFAIGDLGSGARLGQMALQESLLAFDRIITGSALTEALLSEFNNEPGALVEFARAATPGAFGRYAPAVFEHAARGDAVATDILKRSAATIDAALDRVVTDIGDAPISLLGGLGPLVAPWLAGRHQPRFVTPAADALTGAIALGISRYYSTVGVGA